MISAEDAQWLSCTYPRLSHGAAGVFGIIEFRAIYDGDRDRFLILHENVLNDIGGVEFACSYRIKIQERIDTRFSRLPAVYVEGLEPTQDRHFNQLDKSACLCSPFAEDEFLSPSFKFRNFLEELVIPFLYGQSYYSEKLRWPWDEYAHLATGLLEAYADADVPDLERLLRILALYPDWPLIKSVLQRGKIKGHTPCFCAKHDLFRRCHPRALAGARRLQDRIRTDSVALP